MSVGLGLPNGLAPQLVLKVDVDTCRGTLEGVPALLQMLDEFGLRATFLFSLGPDNTGRAIRRVFRRGFLGKVRRTSVTSHYGLRTLLYGVLLPGPDIARRGGDVMRRVRQAGHEVGVHAYDHVRWQDNVARKDAAWTEREMRRAHEAFIATVGCEPATAGAAGWQINAHVPALEDAMGYRYASDVRGNSAFVPESGGVAAHCVQIPTTLPTLDELIGRDGVSVGNVAARLLELTAQRTAYHVYTLHAELEGMGLAGVFRELLAGWQAQGYRIGTLAELYGALDVSRLPRKIIQWGVLPGRAGKLACESGSVFQNLL